MELNRLARILKARWPAVVLISLAGFAAGFALTALTNSSADPVFEGVVSIEFELEGEESVDDLAAEIEGEARLAQFAAQDLLAEYPNSSVIADTGAARLVFYARGDSQDQARERARSLVNAYLEADPGGGGRDITQQLEEYERQAEEIAAEIRALQPDLSLAEQQLRERHAILDMQIARVRDEIVTLTVADAGATNEQQAANEAQREDLRATLEELQSEKATIPPAPSEELAPPQQLRLAALERRQELLIADYQRLALRTMGITTRGSVQPMTINDLTPDPPSPLMNGANGLLAGAGIAFVALFLITRVRREVWLASDLPMPLLGVVPRRRVSNLPGPSWYDTVEGGPRKEAIQALRTGIEGVLDGPTALTLAGDSVESAECRTLAVDVGASFASAGRRVLVIDADYSMNNQLNEFNVGEPTLETVLQSPASAESSMAQRMSWLLNEAIQIRPGLVVIPSGPVQPSPADALAGRQFQVFLDQARSLFDMVIVVAGSARSSTAQVMVQRTGSVLLAVAPGKTSSNTVDALVSDFDVQRVRLIGAVMVDRTESSTRGMLESLLSRVRGQEERASVHVDLDDSPVDRLRFYPTPLVKGWGDARSNSLESLVGGLSDVLPPQGESGSAESTRDPLDFAGELLHVLDNANSSAREPVAEYLVARVEDLMTAVSGQENLSRDLVDTVIRDGFIPLTRVRGHRTVGEWLIEELRLELGPDTGDQVAAKFVRLLSSDPSDTSGSLNSWLKDEFFGRHLERTRGEPEVWHLSSRAGTVQVLAYSRRLDKERLTRINTNVIRRKIDELQRTLQEANEEERIEEIEAIEAKLKELHRFEVAIGILQTGSSDEAKLVYPWKRHRQPSGWFPVWTEGIRPNIAPLQRLGLLARPVLTEEELVSIRSTA